LIDSYAEGLIDKQEFEPRITRLRQRLTALEEQAQQLRDETTLHTELRLIIGRLEDFATKVHDGLEEADWTSKRELIRALVMRVDVAQDEVNVVFRVDQCPTDPDPGKKSLQLRRGSRRSTMWSKTSGETMQSLRNAACRCAHAGVIFSPPHIGMLTRDAG